MLPVRKTEKQFLISFLFILALSLSFYFLYFLLFEEVAFIGFLILFSLFFSLAISFFVVLVLIFSALALEEKKKGEDKLIGETGNAGIKREKEESRESRKIFDFKIIIVYFFAALFFFLLFYFLASPREIIFLVVGSIAIFLFLFAGGRSIEQEKKFLIKLDLLRISKKGIAKYLTGFSILFAVLFFLSPKIIGGEIGLPRPLFDAIWPQIENLFSGQYPGFSGDMTVDDYIIFQMSNIIPETSGDKKSKPPEKEDEKDEYEILPFSFLEEGEIDIKEQKNDVEKEIEKAIDEEREKTTKQALAQSRKEFSKMFGKKLKGDEKMKDVFYVFLSSQLSDFFDENKVIGKIGSWGIIIVMALAIRSIFGILLYILIPFMLFIFFIFRKIGFFKIQNIKVDKEELYC